jgi:hypothetical protein
MAFTTTVRASGASPTVKFQELGVQTDIDAGGRQVEVALEVIRGAVAVIRA